MSNSNGNHNVYPLSDYGFEVSEKPSKSSFWKFLNWRNILIALLVMMVISTSILAFQHKKYGELLAEEAYVVSVSINLTEDNMLLKYGVFPQEVGLAELRSAWINNPCHETAANYYEALKEVYENIGKSNSKPNV